MPNNDNKHGRELLILKRQSRSVVLNMVQRGLDNGKAYWSSLEIILKPQLSERFTVILDRHSYRKQILCLRKNQPPGDFLFECGAALISGFCFWVRALAAKRTTLRTPLLGSVSKTLRLSVVGLHVPTFLFLNVAVLRGRHVQIVADQGARTYAPSFLVAIWCVCVHCASVKIIAINQVTKTRLFFFSFLFLIDQEQIYSRREKVGQVLGLKHDEVLDFIKEWVLLQPSLQPSLFYSLQIH